MTTTRRVLARRVAGKAGMTQFMVNKTVFPRDESSSSGQERKRRIRLQPSPDLKKKSVVSQMVSSLHDTAQRYRAALSPYVRLFDREFRSFLILFNPPVLPAF